MQKIPVRKLVSSRQATSPTGSLSIRSLQDVLAGKALDQPLHRHDFYFLLVIIDGKGHHTIDFIAHKVTRHTVFLLHPGQVHQLSLSADSTGYLLQFGTDFYVPHRATSPLHHRQSCYHFQNAGERAAFEKMLNLFSYMLDEQLQSAPHYEVVISSLLDIVFIALNRLQEKVLPVEASTYQQEKLTAFLSLIEKHLHQPLSVTQYARQLHLSPFQLNAITQVTIGKTASVIIQERIILEAKRLLLATSNQVSQIADQLGHEDASYFIRFFKKHTGYTPEAFRQQFT